MPIDPDKLVELSRSLNLEGKDLIDYLKEERDRERELRAESRARENDSREHEHMKLEVDMRRREEEREHELRLKTAELEIIKAGREVSAVSDQRSTLSCNSVQRPQPYTDGEDITSYIIRFDRIADLLQWNADVRAVQLGSLVQGRALQYYVNFDVNTIKTYDLLKRALLHAFRRSEDQYRKYSVALGLVLMKHLPNSLIAYRACLIFGSEVWICRANSIRLESS